jgi:HSP20 family protein
MRNLIWRIKMAETRNDREQQMPTGREITSRSQRQSSSEERMPARRRSSSLDYATNPFELMRRVSDEMNSMLTAILPFGSVRTPSRSAEQVWAPQIEVFERDGKLVVRADLPGMNKDDVRVEVRDNTLIIEGERREERQEDREGYFLTERVYGSFFRAIPLPDGVNPDKARATFRDGVLELELDLPRGEEQKGKTIPIEESRSAQSQSAQSQSAQSQTQSAQSQSGKSGEAKSAR